MKLERVGEFGLIKRIEKRVEGQADGVLLGIGDDAAAFQPGKGMTSLITTDIFVEGIHFDLAYSTPYQIGWKAMAANLSDIAAMGGLPRVAVVSLCLPERIEVEWVEELYDGMKDIIQRFEGTIIGGDTSAAQSETIINIALIGEVEEKRMVTRSGAKVGDLICVTGELGSSVAGLRFLREQKTTGKKSQTKWSPLIDRHLVPVPRIHEARTLLKKARVNAMIDISDGLASEIHHICAMSGTGAKIYLEEIPIHPQTRLSALESGRDAHQDALYGGEDFELLFTLSSKNLTDTLEMLRNETGTMASTIGAIVEAGQGITLIDENSSRISLPFRGYDHFSKMMIRR